jgi:hypothetical protein
MPLDLLWLTVPGYVVLQVVALMRSSGSSRVAAALPLFVTLSVFALLDDGCRSCAREKPVADRAADGEPSSAGVRYHGRAPGPTVGHANSPSGRQSSYVEGSSPCAIL